MNRQKSWLPGTRAGIREMAANWSTVIGQHLTAWGIPASELASFNETRLDAEAAFNTASGPNRTPAAIQTAREAQAALVASMQHLKRKYLTIPPLTLADFLLLGLPIPDQTRTIIPAPVDHPGIEVVRWSPQTLELRIFKQLNLGGNDKSNYQAYVKYGPVQPGGSGTPTASKISGETSVLSAPPRSAEDLPNTVTTTAETMRLVLPSETSGMACYLAARYVTRSGKEGPLGAMIQTMIL